MQETTGYSSFSTPTLAILILPGRSFSMTSIFVHSLNDLTNMLLVNPLIAIYSVLTKCMFLFGTEDTKVKEINLLLKSFSCSSAYPSRSR